MFSSSFQRAPRVRWKPLTLLTMVAMIGSAAPIVSASTTGPLPRVAAISAPAARADASAASLSRAAALAVADAATNDVQQSISVVDRLTGDVVASVGGDEIYNTESILKLFTAAFYLLESDGAPAPGLAADLRAMIEVSDNGVQSALWMEEIVPTIADRYGLTNTWNGPFSGPESWGSDQTTADDQALFLYRMSLDPIVAPQLMSWMAATQPTGADGFNQEFGFNALTGDHGSKQGWSDPDWSPANMHSVGWTERYFAAVLQNSPTATYATMRATSTRAARLIATSGGGSASAAAAVPIAASIDDLGSYISRKAKLAKVLRTIGIVGGTSEHLC